MVSKPVISRSISRSALLTSAALLLGCSSSGTGTAAARPDPVEQAPHDADLVLVGGTVLTMAPAHPRAEAIAVRDGRIIAVGSDAEMRTWIAARTRVLQLAGGAVTPGLVDAHCHLYGLGTDHEIISVRGLFTEVDIAKYVAIEARRGVGWVRGRGWDQNLWPQKQFPTKATLDAVIADRPVLLRRIDGHAIWVNSAALAAAKVTAATPDPPGGKILRDAKGEPTGVLVDNATALVEDKLPAATAEDIERRIRAAAATAVGLGLTGVHEMGIDDATAQVYERLAAAHQLPLRVYAFLAGDTAHPDTLRTRAPKPPVGRFVMRGVKFFADGALGSRGARLYADYDDDPGNRGLWVTEPAALAKAVDGAVAGGWQVAIHAIGDAGIGSVLDAYTAALAAHPGDHRLRVEHVQVIAPDDVARLVATHAIASMQPTHATSDMPWAEARVGKQRILGAYAWRTMLDHHVPLAFGSDFPVEEPSPMAGIYAAVMRQAPDGAPHGGWYPAQRMTLDEAIAGFTRGAAYAEGAETRRGMIAPGMDADLTVFQQPLEADARTGTSSLQGNPIDATIVGGEVVYVRHCSKLDWEAACFKPHGWGGPPGTHR
jgi:hypothetical protein